MKEKIIGSKICPICGKEYNSPSAISRADNYTAICPECGQRQALESIGVPPEEIEKIVALTNTHCKPVGLQ